MQLIEVLRFWHWIRSRIFSILLIQDPDFGQVKRGIVPPIRGVMILALDPDQELELSPPFKNLNVQENNFFYFTQKRVSGWVKIVLMFMQQSCWYRLHSTGRGPCTPPPTATWSVTQAFLCLKQQSRICCTQWRAPSVVIFC